jgi:hypothetical protein
MASLYIDKMTQALRIVLTVVLFKVLKDQALFLLTASQ